MKIMMRMISMMTYALMTNLERREDRCEISPSKSFRMKAGQRTGVGQTHQSCKISNIKTNLSKKCIVFWSTLGCLPYFWDVFTLKICWQFYSQFASLHMFRCSLSDVSQNKFAGKKGDFWQDGHDEASSQSACEAESNRLAEASQLLLPFWTAHKSLQAHWKTEGRSHLRGSETP